MKSNYEIQVEQSAELFLEYDQETMVKRFDLEHDDGYLYIEYFGSRYRVDRTTGLVSCIGGRAARFNEAMVIYDMLCCSKEGATLSGEWVLLGSLHPSSNFTTENSMFESFTNALSGRTDELKAACEKLGGIAQSKADVGYVFEAFPFFPILFQFWEADEDFGANVNFLFDTSALNFLHFETAWYVVGQLTDMIKEEMGIE